MSKAKSMAMELSQNLLEDRMGFNFDDDDLILIREEDEDDEDGDDKENAGKQMVCYEKKDQQGFYICSHPTLKFQYDGNDYMESNLIQMRDYKALLKRKSDRSYTPQARTRKFFKLNQLGYVNLLPNLDALHKQKEIISDINKQKEKEEKDKKRVSITSPGSVTKPLLMGGLVGNLGNNLANKLGAKIKEVPPPKESPKDKESKLNIHSYIDENNRHALKDQNPTYFIEVLKFQIKTYIKKDGDVLLLTKVRERINKEHPYDDVTVFDKQVLKKRLNIYNEITRNMSIGKVRKGMTKLWLIENKGSINSLLTENFDREVLTDLFFELVKITKNEVVNEMISLDLNKYASYVLKDFLDKDLITYDVVSKKYFSDLRNANFKTFNKNFTDEEYYEFLSKYVNQFVSYYCEFSMDIYKLFNNIIEYLTKTLIENIKQKTLMSVGYKFSIKYCDSFYKNYTQLFMDELSKVKAQFKEDYMQIIKSRNKNFKYPKVTIKDIHDIGAKWDPKVQNIAKDNRNIVNFYQSMPIIKILQNRDSTNDETLLFKIKEIFGEDVDREMYRTMELMKKRSMIEVFKDDEKGPTNFTEYKDMVRKQVIDNSDMLREMRLKKQNKKDMRNLENSYSIGQRADSSVLHNLIYSEHQIKRKLLGSKDLIKGKGKNNVYGNKPYNLKKVDSRNILGLSKRSKQSRSSILSDFTYFSE